MTPLSDAVRHVRRDEAWARAYYGTDEGYADWAPVGRLLPAAWAAGELDREQLAPLLRIVWLRGRPFDALHTRNVWRGLFHAVGYRRDLVPQRRPERAVRLYRGACAARRDGWSWTADLEIAARFARIAARECRPSARAGVWTADVDPARLLAFYTLEDEHVVDTEGLHIDLRPAGM